MTDDNNKDGTTMSSWRELLEISSNKSRKIRGSNYVQLATTAPDGTPRCRTVVFRGFVRDDNDSDESSSTLPSLLKMITDARSQKVQQVRATTTNTNDNPKNNKDSAEMVWWFPKTNEQYRIRGQLMFVGNDDDDDTNEDSSYWQRLRREQWGQLRDEARESFYNTLVPGQPYDQHAAQAAADAVPAGGRDAATGKVRQPPPDNFYLVLLRPTYCDYLRLGAPEQYRQIDEQQADGTWTSTRVNP